MNVFSIISGYLNWGVSSKKTGVYLESNINARAERELQRIVMDPIPE